MSAGDIRLVSGGYGSRTFRVRRGSQTMNLGEPLKRGGVSNNDVVHINNGDLGGIDTSSVFLGLVNFPYTQDTAATGTVDIWLCGAGTILFGDATTAANVDTAQELLEVTFDYVNFDVAASVFTIDEDEGDKPTTGSLFILGGDTARSKLFVTPHVGKTYQGVTQAN